MNVEERIKQLIVEELDVPAEQVVPEADFIKDLNADSLSTVLLVMAFEEEFGFEIADEAAESMKKVGDVIKYVQQNIKEQEP